MAVRTRVFTLLSQPFLSPVETMDPAELPRLRQRRSRVQRSLPARPIVGRAARGCVIEQRAAQLGDERLGVRIYRPSDRSTAALPCVLFFHGGGFVLGAADEFDWLCSQVSFRTPAVVVSVDYRLAPEHPYPAAVTDCWEATQWVRREADTLDVNPQCLAVMGDSAGGNLAAVTALQARDRGGPDIAAQLLLYPAVDMITTFDSERRYANGPVLTSAQMKGFARMYLGGADGTEPYASPLRADDLSDAAPATVLCAEHDPLRDHGAHYAAALEAAGVATEHRCYSGAVHGFLSMPGVVPAARTAVGDIVERLRIAFG